MIDDWEDTDPELFGPVVEDVTRPCCYICGREQSDSFANGKSWTIRQLRRWLATRMPAGEAIAVTNAFLRQLPVKP